MFHPSLNPYIYFTAVVLPQTIDFPFLSSLAVRPVGSSSLYLLHITTGYMSPRPILKRHDFSQRQETLSFSACSSVSSSRHVHFPPTPTLTCTYATHSPATYDRSPVAVPPNQCALPGRHEREFVSSDVAEIKGSYFHPRAYEACSPEPSGHTYPHFAPSSAYP